jgi:hypothetical protein
MNKIMADNWITHHAQRINKRENEKRKYYEQLDNNMDEETKQKTVQRMEKRDWNRRNNLKDEAELFSYPVYLKCQVGKVFIQTLIAHVTTEKIHNEFDIYQDTLHGGSLWVNKINFDAAHKTALKYMPDYANCKKTGKLYYYYVHFIYGKNVPKHSYFQIALNYCFPNDYPDVVYVQKNGISKCIVPNEQQYHQELKNLYCID